LFKVAVVGLGWWGKVIVPLLKKSGKITVVKGEKSQVVFDGSSLSAEAAEQIQAEANLQAQQKIRRGSLVLGGALAAALVLGGLALGSGNRLRLADQQLTASQKEKEQVDQELGQARKESFRYFVNELRNTWHEQWELFLGVSLLGILAYTCLVVPL